MNRAATALFVLTIVKMALVVFASPIIGYANNYDFIREESCVGLWQQYPDRPKTDSDLQRPVNRLVRDGDKRGDLCLRSTDILFSHAVAGVHEIGARVDFREIGGLRAIAVLLIFGLVLFSIESPPCRFALSLAFHLVFGDIAYLCYFNTLYSEFSVVAGCVLSLGMITVIWFSSETPRIRTVAWVTLGLIWLGLSKLQYSPLATMLGLLCALVALRRWSGYRVAAWLAGLALALPFVYRLMNPTSVPISRSIDWCNKINATLSGILPAASDPARALRTLGLPASCQAAIGQSWYSIPSPDHPPCPEVLAMSRARFLPLFLSQPRTFFTPLHRALQESRPFHLFYLGDVEADSVHHALLYRGVSATSMSFWIAALPGAVYLVVAYGSMLAGFGCMSFLLYRLVRKRSEGDPLLILVALGGITAFYGVASSVFGDGYSEVPKHAVGLGIGIAFQLAWTVVAGIRRIKYTPPQ